MFIKRIIYLQLESVKSSPPLPLRLVLAFLAKGEASGGAKRLSAESPATLDVIFSSLFPPTTIQVLERAQTTIASSSLYCGGTRWDTVSVSPLNAPVYTLYDFIFGSHLVVGWQLLSKDKLLQCEVSVCCRSVVVRRPPLIHGHDWYVLRPRPDLLRLIRTYSSGISCRKPMS
jgi:hypothetical protein